MRLVAITLLNPRVTGVAEYSLDPLPYLVQVTQAEDCPLAMVCCSGRGNQSTLILSGRKSSFSPTFTDRRYTVDCQ